jgi:hypothetical protein
LEGQTKGLRPRDCGTKPGGPDQETGRKPRIPWSGSVVSFKPKVQGSNPCALTHQIGISGIRRFAERTNNIAQWTEFDRGGHFPSMEVPDRVIRDIRELFRRFR